MSDTKQSPDQDQPVVDEQDVEGHNMWIGPTVMGDLSRSRSKELEREARDHRRAKPDKSR